MQVFPDFQITQQLGEEYPCTYIFVHIRDNFKKIKYVCFCNMFSRCNLQNIYVGEPGVRDEDFPFSNYY